MARLGTHAHADPRVARERRQHRQHHGRRHLRRHEQALALLFAFPLLLRLRVRLHEISLDLVACGDGALLIALVRLLVRLLVPTLGPRLDVLVGCHLRLHVCPFDTGCGYGHARPSMAGIQRGGGTKALASYERPAQTWGMEVRAWRRAIASPP